MTRNNWQENSKLLTYKPSAINSLGDNTKNEAQNDPYSSI